MTSDPPCPPVGDLSPVVAALHLWHRQTLEAGEKRLSIVPAMTHLPRSEALFLGYDPGGMPCPPPSVPSITMAETIELFAQ